jgi:hypothetical protein
MSDFVLPRTYRYEYRLSSRFGHWRHSYSLIGRWGGLEFHVTDLGESALSYTSERLSSGLEVHHREPPEYMASDPPSHDECWLLKSPCWHDGTSLYARETLLPMFDGVSHEKMFSRLAHEADDRFADSAMRNKAAE